LYYNDIEIVDVDSGILDISSDMYNLTEDGGLKISWVGEQAINAQEGEVLFYLTVRSDFDIQNNAFTVNNEVFNSEMYTDNLDVLNINLDRQALNLENRLYQNAPNPFNGVTSLEFEFVEKSDASLTIYDPSGKVVKVYRNTYDKGLNRVMVNANDLNGNGIYYYQLNSEYFSSTKKMILIK